MELLEISNSLEDLQCSDPKQQRTESNGVFVSRPPHSLKIVLFGLSLGLLYSPVPQGLFGADRKGAVQRLLYYFNIAKELC